MEISQFPRYVFRALGKWLRAQPCSSSLKVLSTRRSPDRGIPAQGTGRKLLSGEFFMVVGRGLNGNQHPGVPGGARALCFNPQTRAQNRNIRRMPHTQGVLAPHFHLTVWVATLRGAALRQINVDLKQSYSQQLTFCDPSHVLSSLEPFWAATYVNQLGAKRPATASCRG